MESGKVISNLGSIASISSFPLALISIVVAFVVNAKTWLLVLIIIVIVVLLIFFIKYLVNYAQQSKFLILYTLKDITQRIGNHCRNSSSLDIYYIGTLENGLISHIVNNVIHNQSTHIVSTNADSFVELLPEVRQKLLKYEAEKENSVFSFKFNYNSQICNFFIAHSKKTYTAIMFSKTIDRGQCRYSGIEIKDNTFVLPILDFLNTSCSLNIDSQFPIAQNTTESIRELWKPFQGYFHDILPPIEERTVREVWRSQILNHFDSYARNLVGDINSDVFITWNIVDKSLDDLGHFNEWLLFLKNESSNGKINVTRYMLINMDKYKREQNYKEKVDIIVTKIEESRNPRYSIYYINSDELSNSIKSDYALIVKKLSSQVDIKIVQNAIIDNKSFPEILKVYFSKNCDEVTETYRKIQSLENQSGRCENFSSLKTQYSIV
jgi:hypothetical protein